MLAPSIGASRQFRCSTYCRCLRLLFALHTVEQPHACSISRSFMAAPMQRILQVLVPASASASCRQAAASLLQKMKPHGDGSGAAHIAGVCAQGRGHQRAAACVFHQSARHCGSVAAHIACAWCLRPPPHRAVKQPQACSIRWSLMAATSVQHTLQMAAFTTSASCRRAAASLFHQAEPHGGGSSAAHIAGVCAQGLANQRAAACVFHQSARHGGSVATQTHQSLGCKTAD